MKKLNIRGVEYTVRVVKSLGNAAPDDEGRPQIKTGTSFIVEGTIDIVALPSADVRRITLFHEMLHCMFDEWSEKDVASVSELVYDMLKRNRLLDIPAWNKVVGVRE